MTAPAPLFARPEHASAVPSGPVPPPHNGGTVAATHPTRPSRVGGGKFAGRACVSPTARPAAPTTVAETSVVGALFGPAGFLHHTSGRPGHHGGAA